MRLSISAGDIVYQRLIKDLALYRRVIKKI